MCRKTIERHHHVQSIAWLPAGEGEVPIGTRRLCQQVILAFLSVEGSEVVKLVSGYCALIYNVPTHFDRILTAMCVPQVQFCGMPLKSLVHQVLDTYHFDRVLIHDIAITPDLQRLLGVGPILYSPKGLHPSKSRVEKQLLGGFTDVFYGIWLLIHFSL